MSDRAAKVGTTVIISSAFVLVEFLFEEPKGPFKEIFVIVWKK